MIRDSTSELSSPGPASRSKMEGVRSFRKGPSYRARPQKGPGPPLNDPNRPGPAVAAGWRSGTVTLAKPKQMVVSERHFSSSTFLYRIERRGSSSSSLGDLSRRRNFPFRPSISSLSLDASDRSARFLSVPAIASFEPVVRRLVLLGSRVFELNEPLRGAKSMDSPYEPIIPGLPDDLALRCLARVSHGFQGLLETVSKKWREVTRGTEYANFKAREGWSGDWLFVLTEGSENQWIAYDPEADRWHPIPKMPRTHPDWKHTGFSCVCVGGRFLVIGGAYASSDPGFPHQKPIITNEVYQFNPFRKEWTAVSSMQTPRSHFACCVISGKVYVAGGRNLSCPRGLTLAECYDPLSNKWEELPPMPNPQTDCIGLSYNGKFHVLNDQVGLLDQNPSEVFCPLTGLWNTVEDHWPFSRAMQVAVQVIENDRVYTIVDWGESLIKTRDAAKGEWYNVGKVPSVFLPNHSRPLEVFDYGFAGLGHELYVLGGKVLKWEDSGAGRFDIVKLGLVRVCDPSESPLNWRETRPMCLTASGSILGCASLEESSVS